MAGRRGRSVATQMRRAALIGVGLVVAAVGVARLGAGSSSARGDRAVRSSWRGACQSRPGADSASLPFGDPARTARRGWSAPVALASAGVPASSLGLSATPGGWLLAGWIQGPPPKVTAGGPGLFGSSGFKAHTHQGAVTTQTVRIAAGTLKGGFARSVQLSAGPSGSLTNLQVTLSAPDVGYVAWAQQPGTALRVGVVCNGRVTVLNRKLAGDAVPLALFPLVGRRAALVFDQYGHGTPFLEYAILSPSGQMGPPATIAHPGTHDTEATELSVNPRGELIASWVHNDAASPPGSSPASPGFVPAELVVAVCKPALRCAPPTTVRLGATKPACVNPAVAINPGGTTTVLAAADDWGNGCDDQLGLRAAVTSGPSSPLQPMQLIRTDGDYPVAQPVGDIGTAIAFNPGSASSGAFGWMFLPGNSSGPAPNAVLDNGGYWNTGEPTLAPANDGWYLVTWTHANARANPRTSLRAAVGHYGQIGPATVAVNAHTHIAAYLGATDGHGTAIILFSGSTDMGNGAGWPYTSGLYATVLRQ